jgi:hypothetical protein
MARLVGLNIGARKIEQAQDEVEMCRWEGEVGGTERYW